MKNIKINFNTIHETVIGKNGVKYGLMKKHSQIVETAFNKAVDFYKEEEINFLNLPERFFQVDEMILYAEELKKSYKNMVIVGIGGSSLGTEAIYNAFTQRYDSEFFPGRRKLYFLDNYDSRLVEYLMDNIDIEETVFVVISKSGGTLETMSQYFYIKETILKTHTLEYFKQRLVFVTDKEKGYLNKLNEVMGAKKFIIPSNVGGRFSIFTPVGLLAAAFVDIDIKKMTEGADAATKEFLDTPFEDNEYLKYSLIQYVYDKEKKMNVSAVLFYNDRFTKFAEWFRQLWAESLGKPAKDGSFIYGTTPISFRGSTDQHSQLQQFVAGKNDKIFTVISLKEKGVHIFKKPELDSFDYMEGYGFNDLLEAAKTGTIRSLIEVNRPVIEINFEAFSEFEFGLFYQFCMISTALTGFMYDINPFDQPGVEQGKIYSIEQLKNGKKS